MFEMDDEKNIFDLVLKDIYGIYGEKKLTKEEIKCYKMTEREIHEKFDNLNENELNTRSNRNIYVKNIIMTNIIKHCRGEKKRGKCYKITEREVYEKFDNLNKD